MSGLEGFKELLEDLVLGLLTRLNRWVLVSSVDTSNVSDIDPLVIILVELIESLSDHLFSGRVQWSSDSSDELVELDEA